MLPKAPQTRQLDPISFQPSLAIQLAASLRASPFKSNLFFPLSPFPPFEESKFITFSCLSSCNALSASPNPTNKDSQNRMLQIPNHFRNPLLSPKLSPPHPALARPHRNPRIPLHHTRRIWMRKYVPLSRPHFSSFPSPPRIQPICHLNDISARSVNNGWSTMLTKGARQWQQPQHS